MGLRARHASFDLMLAFVDHRRPLKPATNSSLAEKPLLRPFFAVVSDFRAPIAVRSLFARLSPTSKIPFQTLLGGDAKVRGR